MTKQSKSTPSGGLNAATTETPQVSPSSGEGRRPDTSGMSVTTPDPKTNQKGSQPTVNLQDVGNNVRLLQALAAGLKDNVFWRKLELKDGQEVIALCFPTSKWQVDQKELKLKK